jgi:protein TonB
MKTLSMYGYKELQAEYNRRMGMAMVLAGICAGLLSTVFSIDQMMQKGNLSGHIPPNVVIRWTEIPLPPPIGITEGVAIQAPVLRTSLGIPVPVPDAMVKPDVNFPTTTELDHPASGETGENGVPGNGQIVIPPGDEPDPDPGTFIALEEPPMPLFKPVPAYPPLAIKANIEGNVYVNVLVAKDGSIKKAVVTKSTADIFDEAALDAAKKWSFRPAMMNHRPVAVWVTIPIRFRLAMKE